MPAPPQLGVSSARSAEALRRAGRIPTADRPDRPAMAESRHASSHENRPRVTKRVTPLLHTPGSYVGVSEYRSSAAQPRARILLPISAWLARVGRSRAGSHRLVA